ncbi:hypothetical protein Tco_1078978 [Tanacetum coccineum]|uniref:Uncharacterized protein n=1 Tax=Tanacetum coccineum TaxID=301880 RepID=A0ABQ5HQU5_9ASTR
MTKKMKDPGLFILPCRLRGSDPFDTLADLGSCVNLIALYLFKMLKIRVLEETDNVLGLADGTKSYPVGIVRTVEKDFMDDHLLREWEIDRDAQLNPFKDVLVFRKMVELLGAIPINFKGNMWESEDMIDKKIDWNKLPMEGDGVWYIRIEMIDPDGENSDRVFQSTPTTRKLSEKEKPSDIIDLEHFHDS